MTTTAEEALTLLVRVQRWNAAGELGQATGDVLVAKAHGRAVAAGVSVYVCDVLAGYASPIEYTPTGTEQGSMA